MNHSLNCRFHSTDERGSRVLSPAVSRDAAHRTCVAAGPSRFCLNQTVGTYVTVPLNSTFKKCQEEEMLIMSTLSMEADILSTGNLMGRCNDF